MSNTKESASSIGFVSLLLLLFIALKLTEVIAWSWWWVLAPAWIYALVIIGAITVLLWLKYKG